MQAIEAVGVRKEYSSFRGRPVIAVDELDLVVEGPGVHGFLGPNGSGKTTTIRCLLGLVRPTQGSIRVLGQDVSELHRVIDRVGALVETPKFFPNFSGRKNLKMLAHVAGISDARVDEVLSTVGLSGRGTDLFKTYSLGMKQRLAVGAALLKDPDVVILDEPANGLDPAGIVEMRQLLRRLAEEGKSVFVSSHQLAEVQLTCDVLTIISHGKVIRSGSVDEVVASVTEHRVRVVIDDAQDALAVLIEGGFDARLADVAGAIDVDIDSAQAADVTEILASRGRFLRALEPLQGSLEAAFLELTGEEGGEIR